MIKTKHVYSKHDSSRAQHDEYETECYCGECGKYLGSKDYTYRVAHCHDFDEVSRFCKYCGKPLYQQFVKPDTTKTVYETEGFTATKGSREYEDQIIINASLLKDNEEALKQVLRNYDQLVKEKNGQENLELPYWCYGFCSTEEK